MSGPSTLLRAFAVISLFVFAMPTNADPAKHTHDMSDDAVMIMAPWVRAAPPTARVMAGYVTLHNQSDQLQRLTRVSSPMFERVEIHESYLEGGVSKMRALSTIDIPAGEMVTFEPNGLHLMLIGPTVGAKSASHIEMTFTFETGHTKTLDVGVLNRGDAMPTMQHPNH